MVELDDTQRSAFERERNILASEDVILMYPSDIGAVLSQEGKPITMISRSIKQAETHYSTNQRELLGTIIITFQRAKLANEVILNCKVFAKAEYDRHPKKKKLEKPQGNVPH